MSDEEKVDNPDEPDVPVAPDGGISYAERRRAREAAVFADVSEAKHILVEVKQVGTGSPITLDLVWLGQGAPDGWAPWDPPRAEPRAVSRENAVPVNPGVALLDGFGLALEAFDDRAQLLDILTETREHAKALIAAHVAVSDRANGLAVDLAAAVIRADRARAEADQDRAKAEDLRAQLRPHEEPAGRGLPACPFCGDTSLYLVSAPRFPGCPPLWEGSMSYSIRCRSCAATGGWAKSVGGARSNWAMRMYADMTAKEPK